MSAINDPALVPYRVSQLESQVKQLDAEKADTRDLRELTSEVRGLRRTLTAFIVAIAGSSVIFAFTVLGAHVH